MDSIDISWSVGVSHSCLTLLLYWLPGWHSSTTCHQSWSSSNNHDDNNNDDDSGSGAIHVVHLIASCFVTSAWIFSPFGNVELSLATLMVSKMNHVFLSHFTS